MAGDDPFWMVIHPDGVLEQYHDKPTLEQLQEAVGGDIEEVPVHSKRFTALANEEGKLKGLPFNPYATGILKPVGDFLVGPVVFIGPPDRKGNSTRLTFDVANDLLTVMGAR